MSVDIFYIYSTKRAWCRLFVMHITLHIRGQRIASRVAADDATHAVCWAAMLMVFCARVERRLRARVYIMINIFRYGATAPKTIRRPGNIWRLLEKPRRKVNVLAVYEYTSFVYVHMSGV